MKIEITVMSAIDDRYTALGVIAYDYDFRKSLARWLDNELTFLYEEFGFFCVETKIS